MARSLRNLAVVVGPQRASPPPSVRGVWWCGTEWVRLLGRVRHRWQLVFVMAFASLSSACTGARFVAQGARGQFELLHQARPVEDVLEDQQLEAGTRQLLSEVQRIRRYAMHNGLRLGNNYKDFVQLDREYVVWFVNASHRLAFVSKTFSFPIVGSFPGLSWFEEQDAIEFGQQLEREGYDVNVRGVNAFSTGGWFDDPLVSSMFRNGADAIGSLANVIFHESVHATVLIKDQQYFNESIASFIANQMTEEYLADRFGPDSEVLQKYLEGKERGAQAGQVLAEYYQRLETLYQSSLASREKLRQKAVIMREVQSRFNMPKPPNNATLIGFRLYRVGKDEFSTLLAACDGNWPLFIRATGSVRSELFGTEQASDVGPVVGLLQQRQCQPLDEPVSRRIAWKHKSEQLRWLAEGGTRTAPVRARADATRATSF